ncbi:hypothetical protein [Leucobacter luti]|uniref:hypothetical protein n=1 Tax=Leucobacter luti TaxID=340320 RepID=UPI003CFC81C7
MPYPLSNRRRDPRPPAQTMYWPPVPADLLEQIDNYSPDDWETPDPVVQLVPPLDQMHGITPAGRISVEAAQEELDWERQACDAVAAVAHDEDEFELVIDAIESYDVEEPSLRPAQLAVVEEYDPLSHASIVPSELGVAALVLALNTLGLHTRGSCRGHPDGWSDAPVVYFAATFDGVRRLAPLVKEIGGGFVINSDHPTYLAVETPSIAHGLDLAERVIAEVRAQPAEDTRRR